MDSMAEDLAISRALDATRDPAEMRALITRRKLVRAGAEFELAIARYERSSPIPAAALVDRYPIIIR
jgi:hypothetical protein